MADTIRELVMKAVATQLATITTGNGYENTIASVQRFRVGGLSTKAIPFIWIKEAGEESSDGPQGGTGGVGLVTNKLIVSLGIGTRQDEAADARSGDEVMNSLRGDVLKCMLTEPRTFGGKAKNCRYLGSIELDVEEDEAELGTRMDFEIIYRHLASNPQQLT